jgi:hypothetical protein
LEFGEGGSGIRLMASERGRSFRLMAVEAATDAADITWESRAHLVCVGVLIRRDRRRFA